jgi:hypothetical protein
MTPGMTSASANYVIVWCGGELLSLPAWSHRTQNHSCRRVRLESTQARGTLRTHCTPAVRDSKWSAPLGAASVTRDLIGNPCGNLQAKDCDTRQWTREPQKKGPFQHSGGVDYYYFVPTVDCQNKKCAWYSCATLSARTARATVHKIKITLSAKRPMTTLSRARGLWKLRLSPFTDPPKSAQ